MKGVIEFLQKPFPQEESKAEIFRIISAVSVFVFFFLYLFKPFGLHTIGEKLPLYCLGFSLVSFVATVIYEFMIVPLLKIKSEGRTFTFGRWVIYFCGAMLMISLANFLFIRLVYFGEIDWSLFPYMIRGVFAVGLFPAVVIGALALLRQERKYQGIAKQANQYASITDREKQESNVTLYDIPDVSVRYIEAMQNYVKIGHLSAGGVFEEQVERDTLTNILASSSDNIVRCHRSWLVNRNSIISMSGNAQGLLLSLSDCDSEIPVSRSYIADFRR